MFKKVLEKLGIFSEEFNERLDNCQLSSTKEERETVERAWDSFKKESSGAKELREQLEFVEELKKIPTHPPITEGKKLDTGKLSYTILPFKAITEVVEVLMFGEQKYGRDNWQKLPNARQRYLDASIRHWISYLEGERHDVESTKHPLAHAVCCLLFIIWFDLVNGDEKS